MKRIVLAIICVIAAASIAVIAVLGVRISPLVSSISEGMDFEDVTLKAEAVDLPSSSAVASLMPLAQAFTGDSFVVSGTTVPPIPSAVNIPGLNINLNANSQSRAAVERSGWTFTQQYTTPDETTSVAVLSDDSGNNSVFAITTSPEGQTPSEYIADLADMLRLFGFDVDTSSSTTGNQVQTVTATQGDTVLEAQAWVDPTDPTKVNIAALKSTEEARGIAEADFAAFVALRGGT
jgi:hypothetical protein